MAGPPPPRRRLRAVLLDALGTLVALEPPAPHLRRELAERGAAVTEAQARRAVAAEIAFYRAHLMEGSDPSRLAELRRRCAAVAREALPAEVRPPAAVVHDALLAALRFRAYPEVPEALARLRGAGLRLVVVSNWDVGLGEVLARTDLAERLDGAVASAEVGRAKPDPEPLRRGLALAGVGPAEAVHVGDAPREDVLGARAAGVVPLLVLREPGPVPDGVAWAPDLAAAADRLLSGALP